MGIYSIKKTAATKTKGKEKSAGVGIRASYLRVVGIQVDTEGAGKRRIKDAILTNRRRFIGPSLMFCFFFLPGRGATGSVSPQEEEELRALAATPNVYASLARSVAPSIYGSDDLKKAITCLLFGGSRKR